MVGNGALSNAVPVVNSHMANSPSAAQAKLSQSNLNIHGSRFLFI